MVQRDGGTARLKAAAIALAAVGAAAGFARAQSADPFVGSTYAEAEAARGQTAFGAECAACHGADLDGGPFGPTLKGAGFAAHWRGSDTQAFVAYLQTRMPPGRPGSLGPETYRDLAAHILKTNGAKAGASGAPTAVVPPSPVAASAVLPRTLLSPRDKTTTAVLAARKAKLDALGPVTDVMLERPPEGDWLIWRRTYETMGFSPLKSIGKANVASLRPAWSWSLPESQNETTPLVHDGVMFVASGNTVQALDAATGDRLWQYVHPLPAAMNGGRNAHTKGMAIYRDKLLAPTADGRLVALDIHSGALLWNAAVAGPVELTSDGRTNNAIFTVAGAPLAAKGKVMLGVSLGLANAKGAYIVAFDAETGKEAWRFNTIAQPGQPGGDSWNGAPAEERFGGGVWTAGSYDPARNLVFFGVGNTYNAGTLLLAKPRQGQSKDALYTDATVAIDPDTGRLAWFYQHMQRDVWDMDWAFEQTLATLPIDGKPRDVVVTGGKIAVFDVMDRATGQYLFSKDLGLQNLVTAIDPKTGIKTPNPAVEPESGKGKLLCPSSSGARSWPATAFNPATRILYVPMIESCADYTWTARGPREVAAGGIDIQFPPRARPDSDDNFGRLDAIDLSTGKVIWSRRQRAPIASSALATAGGLVFNGGLDRRFRAHDAATGKVLWETRLNAAPSSSPITYSTGGEQYLAVVAGGGGSFDSGGRILAPEIDNPTTGVTVVVFKLP